MRETLRLMSSEVPALGLTVQLELVEPPPLVLADKIQFQQVILNLVHNALQASAESVPSNRRLLVTTMSPEV